VQLFGRQRVSVRRGPPTVRFSGTPHCSPPERRSRTNAWRRPSDVPGAWYIVAKVDGSISVWVTDRDPRGDKLGHIIIGNRAAQRYSNPDFSIHPSPVRKLPRRRATQRESQSPRSPSGAELARLGQSRRRSRMSVSAEKRHLGEVIAVGAPVVYRASARLPISTHMDAMAMSPTRSASGLCARRRTHPRLRLRSGLPTWLSLLMVVAACSTNQVNEQPVTNLPLPPSGYSGLAWLLGGTLVIADPGRLTEDTTSRLLFLDELSTGDYTAVSAKSEGCLVRELHSPVALSNGSVAFQELCGVEVHGRLPAEKWSLRQLKGPTEQDLPFLLNRTARFLSRPVLGGPIARPGDRVSGRCHVWQPALGGP
jgi:hypothetical protein